MAVTAWKAAGTAANDTSAGAVAWDSDDLFTPIAGTEITNDDNIYAGPQLAGSGASVWLKATNFGFTSTDIPTGSSIDGFEIEVRQFKSGTIVVASTVVQLVKAGTVSGSNFGNTTDWATTETAVTYGSATQLGGLSWTQSDVTSTNFGMALRITNASSMSPVGGRNRFVDQIRLRVNYTVGGASFDPKKASEFLTFFM
jgi:hypothetical protein